METGTITAGMVLRFLSATDGNTAHPHERNIITATYDEAYETQDIILEAPLSNSRLITQ